MDIIVICWMKEQSGEMIAESEQTLNAITVERPESIICHWVNGENYKGVVENDKKIIECNLHALNRNCDYVLDYVGRKGKGYR